MSERGTEMRVEAEDETSLLVPPYARHLRAIRLLAADAGGRAGLDSSQIADLRIAVDELAHAIMATAKGRILVRFSVQGGQVVIRGTTPARHEGPPPRLHAAAEVIVDAATDQYRLGVSDDAVTFVARKSAGDLP